MNWDQIKGNWKQLTGKVKQKWGKLTDATSRSLPESAMHLSASCRSAMEWKRTRQKRNWTTSRGH